MSPNVDEVAAEVQRAANLERLDTFLASRDAARSLTDEALRSGITVDSVAFAAKRVAQYVDEALAIVQEEYRPALHCKAGCSYCCCKPNVLASVPELVNIVTFVSRTFSADDRAELKARARRYRKQVEGRRVEDPTDESIPCPLLVDGRCTAYEVRPLICRGYNSTNVEACRRAHSDATVLVPTFALLKDASAGATIGAAQQLRAVGVDDAMVDLGTALNIVLETDEDSLQAVLDGHAYLERAENRLWVHELWEEVRQTAITLGVRV
jgi:Fe-S-cluster containining protein